MIELTIGEILRVTRGELLAPGENSGVSGFSIDSRTIEPGQFFIAVKGGNFDGHDYIKDAIEKGASGVLYEKDLCRETPVISGYCIAVDDTLKAMGEIASLIRSKVDIPVVCITGTNGKTTVKDILTQIVSFTKKALASKRSFNNIFGVSLTLFELDTSHEILILELGTNHPGEIAALAAIARPTHAVITNIGSGHIGLFGSIKDIVDEKVSMLEMLPAEGKALLNGDNEYLRCAGADRRGAMYFGFSEGCDHRISDTGHKEASTFFSLKGNSYSIPFEGRHNVYNAAAAISAALSLGFDPESIRKSLSGAVLPEMRLEKNIFNDILFINDSYNANPDSFEAALEMMGEMSSRGKKIVVAGDMFELGDFSIEFHKQVGKSITLKNMDYLVTLGEEAKCIAEGARLSGMNEEKIFVTNSYGEAAGIISGLASPGDVVLIKGSRGMKMEEVLSCFTTSYIR